MRKVKEFNKVSFYKNEQSGIFLQGNGKIGLLNRNLDFEYELLNLNDYQIVGHSKSYLVATNFELTKFFKDGKEILCLSNYGYISNMEDLFLVEDYESGNILSFNLGYESILFEPTEIKQWGQVLWKKNVYVRTKNKLTSYSLSDFNPLWQYDLPESYNWSDGGGYAHKGEVERIIGVYDGVLWFSLNSGRLLGLATEHGKLLYAISQPVIYPDGYVFREENKYLWYGRHWQLDTENGVLFGLTSCYYFELDLKSPNETFALYDVSVSCEQHSIKANMPVLEWSWQGDEIFFGDTDFRNQPSYVGIFNRQTRQITWTSRELGEEGTFKGINKVEYQDNRLYVLDRTSTLHIFERDSTNV